MANPQKGGPVADIRHWVAGVACMCALVAAVCAPSAHAQTNAPSLWFPVGEALHYTIHWGGIHVGSAVISTSWTEEDGRRLLVIRMLTRSNAFLSKFYPVDDTIESVIEPESFLPVRFHQVLNEGRFHAQRLTTFDRTNNVAHFEDLRSGTKEDFPVAPDARDPVSFMYATRRYRFTPGETNHCQVVSNKKVCDLLVKVGKIDKIPVPGLGKVPSIRIEPTGADAGLFISIGRMWLWVSDDDRRILTRVVAEAPIGKFKALLQRIEVPPS
jgi:hypothetical protein